MRKIIAIATLCIVAGLSYSHVAFATVVFEPNYAFYAPFTGELACDNFSGTPRDYDFFRPDGSFIQSIQSTNCYISIYEDDRNNLDHTLYPVGVYTIKVFSPSGATTTLDAVGYFERFSDWTWGLPSGIGFTNTRFVSVEPVHGTTVATTSDVGWEFYLNEEDEHDSYYVEAYFQMDADLACMNSGALYDALADSPCSDVSGIAPFYVNFDDPLDYILTGYNASSTEIIFPQGGRWFGKFTVKKRHLFGLYYSNFMSTTTTFTVGQLLEIDRIRDDIASSSEARRLANLGVAGGIFASTTARLADVCNLFDGFDFGQCLTLTIWDGQAFNETVSLILARPPWGYAYRFYEILDTQEATTTMPSISYEFASTSALAFVGDVHFDPFSTLSETASIVNTVSDRDEAKSIWQILEPLTRLLIYLTLLFMILRDLGVTKHT